MPISVVMPVHNAEKYLAEAIESVLNQSYQDFEFIIVENGSSDSSRQIVKRYAQLDKRIKPFFLEKRGLVKALNFAVKQGKNDWIARMDADDISLPNRLQIQLDFVKNNPAVVMAGSYGYYLSEDGKRILGKIEVGPTSIEEYRHLVRNNRFIFVLNVSTIFSRRIYLELGGYREIPVLEDLDFNCRLAEKEKPILVIPQYLVKVRKIYSSETSSQCFLLQNTMRWIKYSMLQRRSGIKAPSFEEFLAMLKKKPLHQKLQMHREDIGVYFFKKAGLGLSNRRYIDSVLYGSLALLTAPEYVFKKVKRSLM